MRFFMAGLSVLLITVWALLAAPVMAQTRGLGRIADPNDTNVGNLNTSVRIALIIGNAAYPQKPLRNPVNDAKLIARTLQSIGFTVITRNNLTQKQFKRAIRDFADQLARAGSDAIGLVYYAGHGVQVGGHNYLLPVDADITRESDVDIEALSETLILRKLQQAGIKAGIVIIDACRNNPYRGMFRSASRGLVRPEAPAGSLLIAYATSPGGVSADGDAANSPYARALADNLTLPSLTIEQILKRVARQVYHGSQRRQRPWMTGSLLDDIYLGGALSGEAGAGGYTGGAGAAWQLLDNSTDEADYEAFLAHYGAANPFYAQLARKKLAALKLPIVPGLVIEQPKEFPQDIKLTTYSHDDLQIAEEQDKEDKSARLPSLSALRGFHLSPLTQRAHVSAVAMSRNGNFVISGTWIRETRRPISCVKR